MRKDAKRKLSNYFFFVSCSLPNKNDLKLNLNSNNS